MNTLMENSRRYWRKAALCGLTSSALLGYVAVSSQMKVDQQKRDLARVAEREAILTEQREAMRLKLELAQQEIRELRRELDARKRGAK